MGPPAIHSFDFDLKDVTSTYSHLSIEALPRKSDFSESEIDLSDKDVDSSTVEADYISWEKDYYDASQPTENRLLPKPLVRWTVVQESEFERLLENEFEGLLDHKKQERLNFLRDEREKLLDKRTPDQIYRQKLKRQNLLKAVRYFYAFLEKDSKD